MGEAVLGAGLEVSGPNWAPLLGHLSWRGRGSGHRYCLNSSGAGLTGARSLELPGEA